MSVACRLSRSSVNSVQIDKAVKAPTLLYGKELPLLHSRSPTHSQMGVSGAVAYAK